MVSEFKIPSIVTDAQMRSVFSESNYPNSYRGGMLLSEQISAVNFRLRESAPGYNSDWHVAGDPTLIIIQQGVLRILLRDGQYHDFSAGAMFIANDCLPKSREFDDAIHGHRAEVIGEQHLLAVHIKLATLAA